MCWDEIVGFADQGNRGCSFPKITSGRIDGVAQPEQELRRRCQSVESAVRAGNLYSKPDAFVIDCNTQIGGENSPQVCLTEDDHMTQFRQFDSKPIIKSGARERELKPIGA